MPPAPAQQPPTPRATAGDRAAAAHRTPLRRIAAGVDGHPEGRDAAALGATLAQITDAELMLAVVDIQLPVSLPYGTDPKILRKQTERMLAELRASLAPDARTVIEADMSVPRAP
jgi:hypothetical protein